MGIKIESENGKTRVFVDGMEIKGVRSVKYDVSSETVPTVTLDIICDKADIQTDGKVEICSTSTTIDDLVLKRSSEELYNFSKKILKELSKRC